MINFLRSKIDFKASRSPYETSNPDVSVRGTHAASASQTASKRKPSANPLLSPRPNRYPSRDDR